MPKKVYRYYFVLGTNHTLCKVDIVNILSKKGVVFEIIEASEEILLIETKERLEISSLMVELGSVVKAGEIFESYSLNGFPKDFLNEITGLKFKELFLLKKNLDIHFGVSVYNGGGGFKRLNQIWFWAPMMTRSIKEKLNIGYLPLKDRKLPSFLVDKRGLLYHGFELIVVVGSKGIYVGKTLSIQDYKSYSLRDYGRPARDAKSGMIPPKLAKIMINLAGKDKNQIFLDPFCGSGTFLQELVLLDYKNIIGADLEEKAIIASEENIKWLFEKYPLKRENYNIKLFKSDARNLSSKISPGTIDAIVTEPYLGSSKAKFFSPSQIKREIGELTSLYFEAFIEFKKVVKNDGVIVIIFPVFRFKNSFYYLEILDKIYELGFMNRDFLLGEPKGFELLRLNITSRNSVIFFHPDQSVSREVFVFAKTRQ